MVHAYSLNTWKVAAEGSGIQGHISATHTVEFQARNQSQKVREGASVVECLPSMGEALGVTLHTRKEKGKEGRENGLGSNWNSVQNTKGMEG